MKLREVLDKKVGSKKYFKYIITLPKEVVQESELLGKDLKVSLDNSRIVIEREK